VSSGAASLRFWRTALYSKLPPGYFFLQILVDDRVAWERDLSECEPKVWKQERADLTGLPAGKRETTLRLRLALKRTTGRISVMLGVDDLEADGFSLGDAGLEDPSQWSPAQTAPAFLPLVQYFDPTRPVRMLEAVRGLYAHFSGPPAK
jgi:hypothetical protein